MQTIPQDCFSAHIVPWGLQFSRTYTRVGVQNSVGEKERSPLELVNVGIPSLTCAFE